MPDIKQQRLDNAVKFDPSSIDAITDAFDKLPKELLQ